MARRKPEEQGPIRVLLWIIYDLVWIALAAGIHGLGALAAYHFLSAIHRAAGWSAVAFAALPAYILYLTVVVLVIGAIRVCSPRLKPGIYRKFTKGHFFTLVWLTGLNNVVFATPFLRTINFVAFLRFLYYRGMGMKTHFMNWISVDAVIIDPGLVTLGRRVNIGGLASMSCHMALHDHMIIAPIVLGDGVLVGAHGKVGPGVEAGAGALIGANATIGPGVKIGEGAYIEPSSWVESNTVIGPYEKWAGHPAVKVGTRPRPQPEAGATTPPVTEGAATVEPQAPTEG